jgi:NAD(P)H dehydrogenase (quinone)
MISKSSNGRLGHPLLTGAVLLAVAGCVGEQAGPAAADRIIVSGASGQLGGLAVEELLERGVAPENLILVSRTPDELDRYAQLGASTRFGDFTQPESLDSAYAGGDKLLLISLNTSGNPNPRVASERQALHQAAIDAAVRAGVDHVVYTSFVDAENNPSPIAVDHRATEQMLRESGVAWTALRNGWYANGLVDQAARLVSAGRVAVAEGETGTAFVTREDCAAAAAAALTTPGHENRIYEITGDEVITMADLARITSEVTGAPIEVVQAGEEETPSSTTRDSGSVVTDHFMELTGRPPTPVREMLEASRNAVLSGARG